MTTSDDGVRGDYIRMLIVDAAEKWSDPHTRRDARIELETLLAELSAMTARALAAEREIADVCVVIGHARSHGDVAEATRTLLHGWKDRAEAAEADVTRQMAIANEAVNARIAAEAKVDALMPTLTAIAEGYLPVAKGDRYIIVENPNYRPDNGSDPKLVIDVTAFLAARGK